MSTTDIYCIPRCICYIFIIENAHFIHDNETEVLEIYEKIANTLIMNNACSSVNQLFPR